MDVSLLLHELATNAAKYGSLSVEQGSVRVSWTQQDDVLTLSWVETGGPKITSKPDGPSGFGTRLIDLTIEQNLGGQMHTTWHQSGVAHQITLPMTEVAT